MAEKVDWESLKKMSDAGMSSSDIHGLANTFKSLRVDPGSRKADTRSGKEIVLERLRKNGASKTTKMLGNTEQLTSRQQADIRMNRTPNQQKTKLNKNYNSTMSRSGSAASVLASAKDKANSTHSHGLKKKTTPQELAAIRRRLAGRVK